MKKVGVLVTLVIFLSFGLVKNVYASEQDEFRDKAGVVPGSAFYKIDKAIEVIQFNFTKNIEKKVKLMEKFNAERLAESEVLLEEQEVDKANELIQEISANQEKLISLISNIGNIDNLELRKDTEKFIGVLEKVKEQVPAEAKEKINKVIEKQKLKVALIESKKELKSKTNIVKQEIKNLEQEIKEMESQGKDVTEIESKLESYKTSLSKFENEYDLLKEEKKAINNDKNKNDKIDKSDDKDAKNNNSNKAAANKNDKSNKSKDKVDKEDIESKEDADKEYEAEDEKDDIKKVDKDAKDDKNNAKKKETISKPFMDKKKDKKFR